MRFLRITHSCCGRGSSAPICAMRNINNIQRARDDHECIATIGVPSVNIVIKNLSISIMVRSMPFLLVLGIFCWRLPHDASEAQPASECNLCNNALLNPCTLLYYL